MAIRLTYKVDPVPSVGWDNTATYSSVEPNAILTSEFVVHMRQGGEYSLASASYFDPLYLILKDSAGNTLASDTSSNPYLDYGTDAIFDFRAPYTGDYYIHTLFQQGTVDKFVYVAVYEDVDTINPYAAPVLPPHLANDGSALFDSKYYYSAYADIGAAGLNPYQHFMNYGWKEGRDPNAHFDTDGYLAANPDVKAAGLNPFEHYRDYGWKEGRDPSSSFDVERYLKMNPDIKAAGIDPLGHWVDQGRFEGRVAVKAVGREVVDGFDRQFYLMSNSDVAYSGIDPLRHFQSSGWREGRDPNGWFDSDGYLAANADVKAAGMNPLSHFLSNGWKEGRDPSLSFDISSYLAANADVKAAGINPLLHYLSFGYTEGRMAHSDGTWT